MPLSRNGHWIGGIGVAIATIALGLTAGPVGLAAGLGAALAWYALPGWYAFTVGLVVATPLIVSAPSLWTRAVVLLGLLAVLAGPLTRVEDETRTLTAFAFTTAVVAIVGWGVLWTDQPLWLAALVVAAISVLIAYGLHRYELLMLGLVEEAI